MKDRKQYQKKYYEKSKRFLPGLSVKEISIIKFCNPRTVYNHIDEFDRIPDQKPMRFKINRKFWKWQADKLIIPNNKLENKNGTGNKS